MPEGVDPVLVGKLRGMERRYAILSHFGEGTGGKLSMVFRADRDYTGIDAGRGRLVIGLRPFVRHPRMEEVVPVVLEMALDQVRWQAKSFDPEKYGCPEPLFSILEQGKTLYRLETGTDPRFPRRIRLYARLKSERLLETDSFRRGRTFILDPYQLGQRVLLEQAGGIRSFPDQIYPVRMFLMKPLYGFGRRGSYRAFLADWRDLLAEVRHVQTLEETARRGALFREKWDRVFDRESRTTGSLSIPAGHHADALPANPSPRNFQGKSPSNENASRPERETLRQEDESGGKKKDGDGLGLESEPDTWTRGPEIPFMEPSPEALPVFEWNEALIRQEVDSLQRFLKIGLPQDVEDGLVGRLVARKLSEPTFKVMRRPLDPRRPRDLRLLVIMDCSLSMTGAPHYYGAHLVRLVEEARIGRVLDVVACSTRYAFRLDPRHLNLLMPDETDGFYTLTPFLDTIGGSYDLAVVLSDCQNSERSLEALGKLRRKIPTVGCYVLPENLGEMAEVSFERIAQDGKRIFPRAFIHSRTFHGLGRRLALYLNALKGRG
uniref:VWA domain-containing protein n=1 Tax=Leptospirillum ferriphilum TaxID=178606 RepID=A0A7C3QX85_9BACT